MAEVLQVADREHTLAAILLELPVKIGSIDTSHQRTLRGKRPRDIRQSIIPTTVSGEKKDEVPYLGLRLVHAHIVKAAVRERLATGEHPRAGSKSEENRHKKIATHQAPS